MKNVRGEPILVTPFLAISKEENPTGVTFHIQIINIFTPDWLRKYSVGIHASFDVEVITTFTIPPTLPNYLQPILEETDNDPKIAEIIFNVLKSADENIHKIYEDIKHKVKSVVVYPKPDVTHFETLNSKVKSMLASLLELSPDLIEVKSSSSWDESYPLPLSNFSFTQSSAENKITVVSNNIFEVSAYIPPLSFRGEVFYSPKEITLKIIKRVFVRKRGFRNALRAVSSFVSDYLKENTSLLKEVYAPVERRMAVSNVSFALWSYLLDLVKSEVPWRVKTRVGEYPASVKFEERILHQYFPNFKKVETQIRTSPRKTDATVYRRNIFGGVFGGSPEAEYVFSFTLPWESARNFTSNVKSKSFGPSLIDYLTSFVYFLPDQFVVEGDKVTLIRSLETLYDFMEEGFEP